MTPGGGDQDTDRLDDSAVGWRIELSVEDGLQLIVLHTRAPAAKHARIQLPPSKLPLYVGREVRRERDTVFNIEDTSLSKQHFELFTARGTLYLRDQESRNGTFVNGRRAPPQSDVPLAESDLIRAGETVMLVRFGERSERPSAEDPSLPGVSPAILQIREHLKSAARLHGPLLVIGETGTGKEYVARGVHRLRELPADRFVPVNCGELDPRLARSELFGVEKGAFTDAKLSRTGLVAAAERGTLFLDEIGELEISAQAELLRFLEDGKYRAVGGTDLFTSKAQLVAATNVDLDGAVASGKFRQDLLARLRATQQPIMLPPLRKRRDDILLWFERFVADASAQAGRPPPTWSAGVAESLLLHAWPENLRELKSAAGSAVLAVGTGDRIDAKHLPERVASARTLARQEDVIGLPAKPPEPVEPDRAAVTAALERCEGVVRRAASELGLERRKFYRLCEKYGVKPEEFRKREGGLVQEPDE